MASQSQPSADKGPTALLAPSAEPSGAEEPRSAFEVGKPAPYYCKACQAVPQAGYCKMAGCPTAPAGLGSEPSAAGTPLEWDYEGETVFAVEFMQLCCGGGYASCCGEPEIHVERRQVAHCAPEYAPLLAASPRLLRALRNLLVIAGTPITDRQAAIFAEARAAIAKAEAR